MHAGSDSRGLADYSDDPAAVAIPAHGIGDALAPLASDTVASIVGFTELASSGALHNCAAVYHRGAVIGVYRKMHPAINRSVYSRAGKHRYSPWPPDVRHHDLQRFELSWSVRSDGGSRGDRHLRPVQQRPAAGQGRIRTGQCRAEGGRPNRSRAPRVDCSCRCRGSLGSSRVPWLNRRCRPRWRDPTYRAGVVRETLRQRRSHRVQRAHGRAPGELPTASAVPSAAGWPFIAGTPPQSSSDPSSRSRS